MFTSLNYLNKHMLNYNGLSYTTNLFKCFTLAAAIYTSNAFNSIISTKTQTPLTMRNMNAFGTPNYSNNMDYLSALPRI